MDSLILHYLALATYRPIAYLVVFLGMVFEGDIILFSAAFLAHQGILNPVPVFLTALWGMIFGDNMWYSLGRRKNYPFKQWAEKLAQPFDEQLLKNPMRTIFVSKFTYGFNRAILMRAGSLRLNWKKLEESDILATLLWMAIVGGLGYFSSASFNYAKTYLRYGEIALILSLLLFVALEHLINKKSSLIKLRPKRTE